jgi:hypothetical protein
MFLTTCTVIYKYNTKLYEKQGVHICVLLHKFHMPLNVTVARKDQKEPG